MAETDSTISEIKPKEILKTEENKEKETEKQKVEEPKDSSEFSVETK